MRSTQTISFARLKVGAVFKLHLIGMTLFMVPLGLVQGILACFGFNSLSWQGVPIHGAGALLAGPLIGLTTALLFTLMIGTMSALGLWLYSRFRPLTLKVIAQSGDASDEQG